MSAYQDQLKHQLEQAQRDLRAAENELAQLRPLPAQLASAKAELAALHQGEEPYEDERVAATAAQWIWLWNRATPERRLEAAEQVRSQSAAVDRCRLGLHEHRLAELHELRQDWTAKVAERDGAYRERAQLTAWLAALHRAVLAPAPDIDEPGWQILYLTVADQQLSWHIHPRDAELFRHVEQVAADDPRAQWDGHTTAEKYQRIQALTAADQRQDAPRCCVCSTTENGGGALYENHKGQLFCQPCADGVPALAARLSFREVYAALDEIRTQASPATETNAIRAALAGRWVVVSYPICEQIAAHPDTIAELKADLDRVERLHPELWLLGFAPLGPFLGLPLIPDDSLPPGEVHLRPHPRAEPEECGHVNSNGARPCNKPDGHDGHHENRDQYTWDTGD